MELIVLMSLNLNLFLQISVLGFENNPIFASVLGLKDRSDYQAIWTRSFNGVYFVLIIWWTKVMCLIMFYQFYYIITYSLTYHFPCLIKCLFCDGF